jgi:multiple sugar transport system ATP-binding protein
MFVADFIGDPPMSLLRFRSILQAGASRLGMNGARVDVPVVLEDLGEIDVAVGVRPEHVRLADEGALRGRVVSAEYLGTTQVVTVTTEHGPVKARLAADVRAPTGMNVALTFVTDRLSVFDVASGRAIKTAVSERGRHG